jgi:MFS family permease
VILCAALYTTAALGFAHSPASRAWRPTGAVERTRAGALVAAGMRVLVLVAALTAIAFGVLEVALTAFAEAEGRRDAVGPLVTLWALGSVIGGLWYGSRSWTAPVERRFLLLTAALALGTAPLALAPSIAVMGALLVFTGLALAPLATTEYAMVDRLAPAGTPTEAYSWMIVANVVGAGAGSVVAGLLVEEVSVDSALGAAGVACALGLALAVARGRTLEPA